MPVREIAFDVDGTTCRGELHVPEGYDGPGAAMLLCHGIGGVQEMRLDAYAERFCQAGYVVLTFDYRRFGRSDGEPRGLLRLPDEQTDIHSALAFLREQPEVDASRTILWGTSLGGGHAAEVAEQDGKLAAVIAQAPFVSGLSAALALNPVSTLGASLFATADIAAMAVGRGPILLPLIGTPYTPALMTSPDVVERILDQLPERTRMSRQLSLLYRIFAKRRVDLPDRLSLGKDRERDGVTRLLGSLITPRGTVIPNGIAARILARIPLWYPGRAWARVTAPVLFCICAKDTITPPGPTRKAAAQCPNAEIVEYDAGHFDIYTGSEFDQVTADQIAFLRRHVPVAAPEPTAAASA